MPRILFVTLVVLFAEEVKLTWAQPFSSAPQITVSTDKSSYQLFEPVMVNVAVTNQSQKRQLYGSPNWFSPESYVGHRLVDPNGISLPRYPMFNADVVRGAGEVTYEPGETKQATFNVMLAFPVWFETGTYNLETYFPMDTSDVHRRVLVSSTPFDVNPLTTLDSALVDSIEAVLWGTYFQDAWAPGISEDLDPALTSLLANPELPAHVEEFLTFTSALYADMDASFRTGNHTLAQQRYASFRANYPSSVYYDATLQGYSGLSQYGGAEPYEVFEDTVTTLELHVLLEGVADASGQMSTTLSDGGVVPTAHPYDDPPWSYDGFEEVYEVPQATVDWLHVVLVDSLGTVVDRAAGILYDYDTGLARVNYANLPPGHYYVIVDHRNHLAVASDTLVDFTSGYAEHDFTTGHAYTAGGAAQETIISGEDTVYAMFTADANIDGQVTASDFNQWLVDQKAVATGYLVTDFSMDAGVTTSDFNLWLNNTKKVAEEQFPVNWRSPNALSKAPWTGGSSEALPKSSAGETIHARNRVTGDPYWPSGGYVNVPIALKTNADEVETLGSATFDVYFNSDQIYYDHAQQYQALLDAGYTFEINQSSNQYGAFVRVDIRTELANTVSYQIDDQYPEKLLRLRFYENNGQITDHGVAMNLYTLDVVLLSGGVYEEPDELIPVFKDAYPY